MGATRRTGAAGRRQWLEIRQISFCIQKDLQELKTMGKNPIVVVCSFFSSLKTQKHSKNRILLCFLLSSWINTTHRRAPFETSEPLLKAFRHFFPKKNRKTPFPKGPSTS